MQQHTNSKFPAGQHPYLKREGKPAVIFPKQGSYSPEHDPSNFSMDGKLGQLLRSRGFLRFMHPYHDSDEIPGKCIEQIWQWLTWELGLRRWADQTATDLDWLDERLRELDFLTRQKIDGEVRWVWEGC